MLSSKTQPGKRHDPPARPARPTTPYCPMRGARCLSECAWSTPGGCAMAVLAVQSARQANELYAIAEIIDGGHVEPADTLPDSALERPLRH